MRPNRDSLRTRDSELSPHGYVPQGDRADCAGSLCAIRSSKRERARLPLGIVLIACRGDFRACVLHYT